jgi:hypothetical protein
VWFVRDSRKKGNEGLPTSGNGSSFIWTSWSTGAPLVSGMGSDASIEGMGASAIVVFSNRRI